MCGIVGYLGKERALPILIDGLKNLEYRGYDSSGVVILDKNGASITRSVGRVQNLEARLEDGGVELNGVIGIAHTRWATHGKVSEENAHPHRDCRGQIFVVHNGIIENYKELKTELAKEGHQFFSETDTEVLAHLIEKHYKPEDGVTLFVAVRSALREIRGTYGIAVVSSLEPSKIIAARNSSPLILGIGATGNIVASDASAIVHQTKDVVYLKDEEIVELTADNFKIETLGSAITTRAPERLEWDAETIKKGGHEHFMHKEIFEIPETIKNSTRGRMIIDDGMAKLGGIESIKEKLLGIERLKLIACGTASYAARVGEYMLEEYAGIPT